MMQNAKMLSHDLVDHVKLSSHDHMTWSCCSFCVLQSSLILEMLLSYF